MLSPKDTKFFEDARPRLLGIGYRILGTLDDAEDVMQDTFIKWANVDRESIKDSKSWLTTVYTRRCLDVLKSSERTRLNYIGAWLPEPIHTLIENEEEKNLDLSVSLKMAFILMLNRLTPKERAAYLLHEIFDTPYTEVAQILDISESACRKLVSRAKLNIVASKIRYKTPMKRQDELLNAFQEAISKGNATKLLTSLLSDDVHLTADGGGKVPAILDVIEGRQQVLSFITRNLHEYWADFNLVKTNLNGERGFVVNNQSHAEASVSFSYDEEGKVTNVFIMRNPEKLMNLREVFIH